MEDNTTLQQDEKFRIILNRMQLLCSRRECCSGDVRKKCLSALDGDQDRTALMMSLLEKDKFIDDSRYAALFAREKARLAGWGPLKIKYALASKGIPGNVAEAAVKEIEADESLKKIEAVAAARYRSIHDAPDSRLKLLRFVMGRGFDYPAADIIVRKVISSFQNSE